MKFLLVVGKPVQATILSSIGDVNIFEDVCDVRPIVLESASAVL